MNYLGKTPQPQRAYRLLKIPVSLIIFLNHITLKDLTSFLKN
ncbi:hypothetical protein P278_26130 [Zhouia amylolytica AD3]|uniref:Uncharacterized protein n=1 Tax=Zhouia amylolytica AD3 TaxID=1286632 RepID=W2UKI3_9FLAO|nr:hypothetical protein P278_26130 [Zhouia amylolytica AD3]